MYSKVVMWYWMKLLTALLVGDFGVGIPTSKTERDWGKKWFTKLQIFLDWIWKYSLCTLLPWIELLKCAFVLSWFLILWRHKNCLRKKTINYKNITVIEVFELFTVSCKVHLEANLSEISSLFLFKFRDVIPV